MAKYDGLNTDGLGKFNKQAENIERWIDKCIANRKHSTGHGILDIIERK